MQRSPPAAQQLDPQEVAQRLEHLCEGLGLRPKQAAFMVAKQPGYMLLTPLPEIRAKVQELADALGLPPAAVLRTALTVPSILVRKTATVARRVHAYSSLLRCSPLDVLHVLARGPEYLSDTPSSVRQRMVAMGLVLRRPRCTIAAMLQARPDLVCMSAKVMNTKVNGLMSILDKEKRHVVTLLVKHPALMRCDLDRARAVFSGLQVLLRKREGFVYAMICHAPQLLLLPPRGLHQRCVVLRRCLAASPDWVGQFVRLRPPHVAQLLLNRRCSLRAMMFCAERRGAGSVALERLLASGPNGGPAAALGDAWPEFHEWLEVRRRAAELRLRQRRAAMAAEAEAEASGRRGAPGGPVQLRAPGPAPHKSILLPPAPPVLPHLRPAAIAAGALSAAVATAASLPAPTSLAGSIPQGGRPEAPQEARQPIASVSGSGNGVMQAETRAEARGRSEGQVGGLCSSRAEGHGTASSSGSGVSGGRGTCGGSNELDEVVEFGPDRWQQPGASSSGRQTSWLQLQAQYRRSLQSRARRKPPAQEPPAPVGSPAVGAATAGSKAGQRSHGSRSAPSLPPQAPPAHLTGTAAAAGGGTPVADAATASGLAPATRQCSKARVVKPRGSAQEMAALLGGSSEGLAAGPAAQGRISRHTVSAGNQPPQPPVPNAPPALRHGESSTAIVDDRLNPTPPSGQPASGLEAAGSGASQAEALPHQQQGRHALSGLLWPGRGPRLPQPGTLHPGQEPAGSSGNGGGHTGKGEDGGAVPATMVAVQAGAHALSPGHAELGAVLEPAARPGLGGGAASNPPLTEAPCAHGGSTAPSAHLPLWLHLQRPSSANGVSNGNGAGGAGNGGASHVVAGSAECLDRHLRPAREEAHVVRAAASASPQAELPPDGREEQDCSSSVVVVGEDGAVHEITALDREACEQALHGRGRRDARERDSRGAPGQAHALEHALGTVSQR